MNGVIERIFSVIKEKALEILINAKLNDTAQKILWEEVVHKCEHIRNSMDTTVSTTSPFENIYGEKPNIIGLFLEFGRIGYVTKREIFKNQMTDKTFKVIMVRYAGNHTRDTYKLYNLETKRVIMTIDVKWEDWKNTIPADTVKMFCEVEKEDLVPGIEEDVIRTSKPEENMPVYVVPNEGERVRPDEIYEKSS